MAEPTTLAKKDLPPEVQAHAQRAADAALDRALDGRVDPELRAAAKKAAAPWVARLVRWLDDLLRVPGTRFGIGLDAVIGMLVPGAGDTITGVGSVGLLFYALRVGVPTVILVRMIQNILVDVVGGLVPVAGDAFDVFWRSNRRNLDLIEKHAGGKERPSLLDYALVYGGVALAVLSVVLPIVIFYGSIAAMLYSLYSAVATLTG